MNSQFGIKIRILREEQNLLLRQIAPLLDMDTAQLSKIERGERNAKREHVKPLAKLFKVDHDELFSLWLGDQVFQLIVNEEQALQALKIAERELKKSNKK
jgi:transcriptional regulator with XRE-family HTH domain